MDSVSKLRVLTYYLIIRAFLSDTQPRPIIKKILSLHYYLFTLMKGFYLISVVCALAGLSACREDTAWHKESGMVWNTIYNVTWQGPADLRDSIIPALRPVDEALSVFNDSSIVSKVNCSLSTPVDSHFIKIYNESKRINAISDGMFDPTLSPAITAWGFGKGHAATSDTLRCDSLLTFVGIEKTTLKDHRLIKEDIRTQFNFSALAKGYGVDLIAEMFRRNNVENFLIEIGGEISCAGHNSKNAPWHIAIDVPSEQNLPGKEIAELISITDVSVATSGNYRNFFTTAGGKKYGHTISPVTCRPIITDVISATVIHPSCMTGDALATACMAVGSKKALDMCRKADAGVLLILQDSTILKSDNFPTYSN